jgi:KUP system potassium uptake protein
MALEPSAGPHEIPSEAGPPPAAAAPAEPAASEIGLPALALGALGVVYGDIGTSPLYAIRECFQGSHGVAISEANVLGVLSLVVWSLVLVVCVKYLTFIMRADNEGEGGILALLALQRGSPNARWRRIAPLLALIGAGLLYGDGAITPAISILGAIEGIEVATPALRSAVVPITVVLLIALFSVQRFGTGRIGSIFGWVMLAWFLAIGVAGAIAALRQPGVLAAVNPVHAVGFLIEHDVTAFLLLASVVLVVTGSEALYTDMGHFGALPIRTAWYSVVMPALVLNYLGQGAVLIEGGVSVTNPFYALAPGVWLYPMLVLATLAAIIASQALISGAYSLTRSAVQLGFFPRVRIVHTSGEAEGQIYVPEINWLLLVLCLALVLGFGSSSRLAAAYGIAVTGTMMMTSILFFGLARGVWHWSLPAALGLAGCFLIVDLAFFSANLTKVAHGGWVPLVLGAVLVVVMTTWRQGREILARYFVAGTVPADAFLADVRAHGLPRVPGTAVFMTSNPDGIPPVLLHHVKHNKMLHEQLVLLSITTEQVPTVPFGRNFEVEELGDGFWRVNARYGFMQTPNVPRLLAVCLAEGLAVDLDDTSYFLGRETLLTGGPSRMARWRKTLFAYLSRNSRPATQFFGLPPNRVVELGAQIEI